MKKLLFALALVPAIAGAEVIDTFQKIVDALAAAQSGEEVIVADGTYEVTQGLVVPAGVTLRSENGRDKTVLMMPTDSETVAYKCVVLSGKDAVLDGFTVRDFVFTAGANGGCAINISGDAGGTVKNCRVTNCTAAGGNGIVGVSAGALVSHCIVDNNMSSAGGSQGIGYTGSKNGKITIEYCLVVGGRPKAPTSGNSNGPALYLNSGGEFVVSHCTICDSYSTTGGFGINNNNRTVTVKDSIVLSSCHESRSTYVDGFSSVFTKIVFKNSFGTFLSKMTSSGSENNIDAWNPGFVNPILNDYHLRADSPCIGAASDGGDIGCFPYDSEYKSPVPVVSVPAGGDIAAAVASAADYSEIQLAAGEYTLTGQVRLDRPLRIVGAGRDKTIVKSDGKAHRLFHLAHFRSAIESMTLAGAVGTNVVGTAVYINSAGGFVRDCRITGTTVAGTDIGAVSALAVSSGGAVEDTQLDGNTGYDNSGAISIYKGDTGYNKIEPHYYRCLVFGNKGCGFFGNNGAAMSPTCRIRKCTFADQAQGWGLSSSRAIALTDCIIVGGMSLPLKEFEAAKLTSGSAVGCCYYSVLSGGTTNACVVGYNPKFVDPAAGDYHLCADSPCRGIGTDGSDVGCFAYDPEYVPSPTVVDVSAGSDLAVAVENAPDGAVLRLAEGVHYVTKSIVVSKALRITGVGGRDETFIEPVSELAPTSLFVLKNHRAILEKVTIRKFTGRAVFLQAGGRMEDCRVTDATIDSAFKNQGVGALCRVGHVNRCVFDNIAYDVNENLSIVRAENDTPISTSPDSDVGYVDNSLVTYCTGRNGRSVMGRSFSVDRNGVNSGGVLRNCTAARNSMGVDFHCTSYARRIQNCIFTGGLSVGLSDANKLTRMFNNCMKTDMGTDCVVTDNPNLNSKCRPRPSSPVVGKAKPLICADEELDLAGNPRVREDGTQDIGCNQWMPSGLMMLVK